MLFRSDQATLEKIANSVKEVKEEALPVYQMEWIPDGFRKSASTVTPQMVTESWSRETQTEGQPRNRTHFRWYYSREPQAARGITGDGDGKGRSGPILGG